MVNEWNLPLPPTAYAPDGYSIARIPAHPDSHAGTLLACNRCGALVLDPRTHEQWHADRP